MIAPFLEDRGGYVEEVVRPLQAKEETIYVVPGSDAEQYVEKRFPHKTVRTVGNGLRPQSIATRVSAWCREGCDGDLSLYVHRCRADLGDRCDQGCPGGCRHGIGGRSGCPRYSGQCDLAEVFGERTEPIPSPIDKEDPREGPTPADANLCQMFSGGLSAPQRGLSAATEVVSVQLSGKAGKR